MTTSRKLIATLGALIAFAASCAWSQTAAKPVIPPDSDFDFELIRDETALRVSHYKGTAKSIEIPAQIQGFPVKEVCELNNGYVTNLVIPEGVEKIKKLGVWNVSSVKLPSTLTLIGRDSFFFSSYSGEPKLTSIELPKNLKMIGFDAFFGQKNLTHITFPEGLEVIKHDAFAYTGLKSVTFPSSIRIVEYDAFRDCKDLDEVNVPENYKIFWIPCGTDMQDCSALDALSHYSAARERRGYSTYSNEQSPIDYKLALKIKLKHIPSTLAEDEARDIIKKYEPDFYDQP